MAYYTLDEAAKVLQTTQDEVKKMADTKKIRAFRDRGTLRFRAQDIDELVRQLGLGSDPELQFGDKMPEPKRTPSTPPPAKKPKEPDVFEFKLDDDSDQVELGELAPSSSGSSSSKIGKSGKGSSKSKIGRTPPPKPGSDSDVRLVADGSDLDFQIAADSDVAPSSKSSTSLSGKKKNPAASSRPDSGVRILPLEDESDSDVKMVLDEPDDAVPLGASKPKKSGSDSDIRLEQDEPLRLVDEGSDESLVTEEIDLDAELRKQMAEQASKPPQPKPKKKKSKLGPASKLPTSSPFELDESDVDVNKTAAKPSAPSRKVTQHAPKPLDADDSDDFELAPSAGGDQSPLELSEEEIPMKTLDDDSDEVALGGTKTAEPGASGINLKDPVDSGISLEEESSDGDFELTLDDPAPPAAKKKPSKLAADSGKGKKKSKLAKPQQPDSDSEFELSLDDGSPAEPPLEEGSDSEFELSLEGDGSSEFELEAVGDDSSSEFELTLDESGGMEQLEEEASGEDKDIFETDFEVPALDDDSGSEAVALESDTDLESSDFDIALEEGDAESEDESASQVVALEEEEAEEGAETVAKPRGKAKKPVAEVELDEDEDFGDLSEAEVEEDEDEVVPVGASAAPVAHVQPGWGPVPALLLLPCFILLLFLMLMAFEMMQGMWGYQNGSKVSSIVIKPVAEMFGQKVPE